MSKYIENKNRYLRLQQKGGNDQCMEQGCKCKDSRICTCAVQHGLLEHKHKSVRHDLDKLLVEPQLLNILGYMYGPVVQQIACGSNHSLALLSNGHVISWDTNLAGEQMNFVPPAIQGHVIQIAGSGFFSVALLDDKRTIYIWNNTEKHILLGFTEYEDPLSTWVTQITCGPSTLLISLNTGCVKEWSFFSGEKPDKLRVPGELSAPYLKIKKALDESQNKDMQREVTNRLKGMFSERELLNILGELYAEANIRQIASGHVNSTVLFNNGDVKIWTRNSGNFLPIKDIPMFMTTGQVKQIAISKFYSLALLEDGSVNGWGIDHHKRIPPAISHAKSIVDRGIEKDRNIYIKQIACSESYSAVLLNNGVVNTIGPMNMPQELKKVIQRKATHIVSGDNHILVLLNNGTVAGWRRREYTGTITISAIPAEIRAE